MGEKGTTLFLVKTVEHNCSNDLFLKMRSFLALSFKVFVQLGKFWESARDAFSGKLSTNTIGKMQLMILITRNYLIAKNGQES